MEIGKYLIDMHNNNKTYCINLRWKSFGKVVFTLESEELIIIEHFQATCWSKYIKLS
jgi:hypothetical protein